MGYDSRPIANFLLDEAQAMSFSLTNMALNKILYFCHGWYLAKENTAFLSNQFEAWEHGPVIPVIYHQFKSCKERAIDRRATIIDFETGQDVVAHCALSISDADFLTAMLRFYGHRSGATLRMMSHEPGAPWDLVWHGAGTPAMIISDESIRAYFSGRLERRSYLDVN